MERYYVDKNDSDGWVIERRYFDSERKMFLWLEEHSVTYYPERGITGLADGTSYEYGKRP